MQKMFGSGASSTKSSIAADATSTMKEMLLDGLNRIARAAPRKNRDLRKECTDAMARIQSELTDQDVVADPYFYPFKLACESGTSKVRLVALDAIQLLISFGFLYGDTPADPTLYPPPPFGVPEAAATPASSGLFGRSKRMQSHPALEWKLDDEVLESRDQPRRIMDVIIEATYDCGLWDDNDVHLRALKVLLTIITAQRCQVHGQTLMLAVRACYHIALMSRSKSNQETAKSTLSQMFSYAFARMESAACEVKNLRIEQGIETSAEPSLVSRSTPSVGHAPAIPATPVPPSAPSSSPPAAPPTPPEAPSPPGSDHEDQDFSEEFFAGLDLSGSGSTDAAAGQETTAPQEDVAGFDFPDFSAADAEAPAEEEKEIEDHSASSGAEDEEPIAEQSAEAESHEAGAEDLEEEKDEAAEELVEESPKREEAPVEDEELEDADLEEEEEASAAEAEPPAEVEEVASEPEAASVEEQEIPAEEEPVSQELGQEDDTKTEEEEEREEEGEAKDIQEQGTSESLQEEEAEESAPEEEEDTLEESGVSDDLESPAPEEEEEQLPENEPSVQLEEVEVEADEPAEALEHEPEEGPLEAEEEEDADSPAEPEAEEPHEETPAEEDPSSAVEEAAADPMESEAAAVASVSVAPADSEEQKHPEPPRTTQDADETARPVNQEAQAAYHRVHQRFRILVQDAYLMLRAMCQLSRKTLPSADSAWSSSAGGDGSGEAAQGSGSGNEAVYLKSKLLSLDLIRRVLEDEEGATFHSHPVFIRLVRTDLVSSLMSNLGSAHFEVFSVATRIFMSTMKWYQAHLKTEIGVFLGTVFLRIVTSRVTTHNHRMTALDVFSQLFRTPQTLVELFLNYDCSEDSPSIVQMVVSQLEKLTLSCLHLGTSSGGLAADSPLIAFSSGGPTSAQVTQLREIRASALQTLVSILRSIVIWTRNAKEEEAAERAEQERLRHQQQLTGGLDTSRRTLLDYDRSDAPGAPASRSLPPAGPKAASVSSSGSSSSRSPLEDGEITTRHRTLSSEDFASTPGGAQQSQPQQQQPARPRFSEQFNAQRERQRRLETAVVRFNLNPKKGIEYALASGVIKLPTEVAETTPSEPPTTDRTDATAEAVPETDITRRSSTTTKKEGKQPSTEARDRLTPAEKAKAAAIAEWFLSAQGLDKRRLGEYMGEGEAFNIAVLYAYTEAQDFTGQHFDEAIRSFLQGFRLPGEAQKIDRMMEKFAEQYCKHNPEKFSSADAAYVLAYSIIMLNTDAHNPMVKRKMTLEEFIRQNRGIDDGKNLEESFLTDIYYRIVENEIRLNDEHPDEQHSGGAEGASGGGSGGTHRNRRKVKSISGMEDLSRNPQQQLPPGSTVKQQREHQLKLETEDMVRRTKMLLRHAAERPSEKGFRAAGVGEGYAGASGLDAVLAGEVGYYQATRVDFEAVQPLFETVWPATLATFSLMMEAVESPRHLDLYESDPTGPILEGQRIRSGNTGGPVSPTPKPLKEADRDAARIVSLCLDGYRYAIRVSSVFNMDTPRVAFINSLTKLTLLEGIGDVVKQRRKQAQEQERGRSDSIASVLAGGLITPGTSTAAAAAAGKPHRLMTAKHIQAIRALLTVAQTEGNYLGECWIDVLGCVSELERLTHLDGQSQAAHDVWSEEITESSNLPVAVVSPVPLDAPLTAALPIASPLQSPAGGSDPRPSGVPQPPSALIPPEIAESTRLAALRIDLRNAELLRSIDSTEIDRIFSLSSKLHSEAIVDFVDCLRLVSEEELASVEKPRVFCLQKLVEVTSYNMEDRIRLVWSRIWSLLSPYFVRAGCHPNLHVCMYACDSLRQLAMKFLEKDELTHYQFQKQFFSPFAQIMKQSTSMLVRELVVNMIHGIVKARKDNVKSGWSSVFEILLAAAEGNAPYPFTDGLGLSLMPRPPPNFLSHNTASQQLTLDTYAVLSSIMTECFDLVAPEHLPALLRCWSGLAYHPRLAAQQFPETVEVSTKLSTGLLRDTEGMGREERLDQARLDKYGWCLELLDRIVPRPRASSKPRQEASSDLEFSPSSSAAAGVPAAEEEEEEEEDGLGDGPTENGTSAALHWIARCAVFAEKQSQQQQSQGGVSDSPPLTCDFEEEKSGATDRVCACGFVKANPFQQPPISAAAAAAAGKDPSGNRKSLVWTLSLARVVPSSVRYWVSVFDALLRVAAGRTVSAASRTQALALLLGLAVRHGDRFCTSVWKLIFQTVYYPLVFKPLILSSQASAAKRPGGSPVSPPPSSPPSPSPPSSPLVELRSIQSPVFHTANELWLRETGVPALFTLMETHLLHTETALRPLLSDWLEAIRESCVSPAFDSVVAVNAVKVWIKLLHEAGPQLSSLDFDAVLRNLQTAIQESLPRQLLDDRTLRHVRAPFSLLQTTVSEETEEESRELVVPATPTPKKQQQPSSSPPPETEEIASPAVVMVSGDAKSDDSHSPAEQQQQKQQQHKRRSSTAAPVDPGIVHSRYFQPSLSPLPTAEVQDPETEWLIFVCPSRGQLRKLMTPFAQQPFKPPRNIRTVSMRDLLAQGLPAESGLAEASSPPSSRPRSRRNSLSTSRRGSQDSTTMAPLSRSGSQQQLPPRVPSQNTGGGTTGEVPPASLSPLSASAPTTPAVPQPLSQPHHPSTLPAEDSPQQGNLMTTRTRRLSSVVGASDTLHPLNSPVRSPSSSRIAPRPPTTPRRSSRSGSLPRPGPTPLPFSTRQVVGQCQVQLLLMDASFRVLLGMFLGREPPLSPTEAGDEEQKSESLSGSAGQELIVSGAPSSLSGVAKNLAGAHILRLLPVYGASIQFARRFDANPWLRERLWHAGFLRERQSKPPELFYQEGHALTLSMQLLLHLYARRKTLTRPESAAAQVQLFSFAQRVLLEYLQLRSQLLIHQQPAQHQAATSQGGSTGYLKAGVRAGILPRLLFDMLAGANAETVARSLAPEKFGLPEGLAPEVLVLEFDQVSGQAEVSWKSMEDPKIRARLAMRHGVQDSDNPFPKSAAPIVEYSGTELQALLKCLEPAVLALVDGLLRTEVFGEMELKTVASPILASLLSCCLAVGSVHVRRMLSLLLSCRRNAFVWGEE